MTDERGGGGRARALLAGKLVLGIGLLLLLLRREGAWSRLGHALGDFRWSWVPALLGLSVLLVGVSCLKWRLLLRHRGVRVPLPRLMGLYLIGIFFNNFLPTMVGGDAMRSYLLGRRISSQARSLASVFLERGTGLVALVTLAAVGLALRPGLTAEPLVAFSAALLVAVGGGLAVALRFPSLARRLPGSLAGRRPVARLLGLLDGLRQELTDYRRSGRLLAGAMGLSFAFHLLAGLNVLVVAGSLGLRLDPLATLALTPIILLVAAIPATPNGLGVWEWAFSFYLIGAGATPEQGLAIALVIRARALFNSLLGGLLFLGEGLPLRRLRAEEAPLDAAAGAAVTTAPAPHRPS